MRFSTRGAGFGRAVRLTLWAWPAVACATAEGTPPPEFETGGTSGASGKAAAGFASSAGTKPNGSGGTSTTGGAGRASVGGSSSSGGAGSGNSGSNDGGRNSGGAGGSPAMGGRAGQSFAGNVGGPAGSANGGASGSTAAAGSGGKLSVGAGSAGSSSAGSGSSSGSGSGGASTGQAGSAGSSATGACDAAHAVSTITTGQVYLGKASDCVRLAINPTWSTVNLQLQPMPGTAAYPVSFSFFGCAGNGQGSLSGDYASVVIKSGPNPGCDYYVQFSGGASALKLTYYD